MSTKYLCSKCIYKSYFLKSIFEDDNKITVVCAARGYVTQERTAKKLQCKDVDTIE